MSETRGTSLVILAATAGLSGLAAAAATAWWFRRSAAAAAALPPITCSVSIGPLAPAAPPKPKSNPYDPQPRSEYLSWDDYFIALAFLSAQRSKDPNKQVGAVLVSQDNIILGIGYNGFPRGCPDHQLPWAKQSHDGDLLSTKYPYVCHAEMNAVLNKNTASLVGAKVYVTMLPCHECAKLLIQAGVAEIVFFEGKNAPAKEVCVNPGGMRQDQSYAAAKKMLAMTGVSLRQYRPKHALCIRMG